MAEDAKKLIEQAVKLSPEQKIELIELLWDSIAADHMPPLTAEQIAELERRERLFNEDPSRAIPWGQARKQIREELERRRQELGHQADAS